MAPHILPHPRNLLGALLTVTIFALLVGCQSTRAVEPTPPPEPEATQAPPEPEPEPEPPRKEEPEPDNQVLIRQTFVAKMDAIESAMNRIGGDEFDTSRYLDAMLVAGDGGRRQAIPKVLATLTKRLDLEVQVLDDIDAARVLYKQFTLVTEIERRRLIQMNDEMGSELGLLNQQMALQNQRLAKAFNTDREMKLFTHFTGQKEKFVESMEAKLKAQKELPSLENYFDRWTELVKTRILADQYQILNLAYYAKAFNYTDELHDVMTTVSSMTATDHLKDVAVDSVNAATLTTVLDAGFSDMVKAVYEPTPEEQTSRHGLRVSIVPDRGLGGTYYYSDSPEGLEDPTRVNRPDGSYYFAERVTFTVRATRDCNFIMRHVDARGKVTQICPNKYAPDVNTLQANRPMRIPGTSMPFEFATTEPPGIEAIRLVVSPQQIAYNPDIDKVDIDADEAADEQVAMATRGTRGLKLQAKTDPASASSIDEAWLDESQDGNAVQIETFIKVMPLRR